MEVDFSHQISPAKLGRNRPIPLITSWLPDRIAGIVKPARQMGWFGATAVAAFLEVTAFDGQIYFTEGVTLTAVDLVGFL